MHQKSVTFALLGLFTRALALAPNDDGALNNLKERLQGGGRITQVAAGSVPPGSVAMMQTYQKFNKKAPRAVADAAATQKGSVEAANEYRDNFYIAPVTIGDETLLINFDTGSSDFWTFSTLLPEPNCSNHTCYQLEGTEQTGENWIIWYGDGSSASGIVYADKVEIGGVTATVENVQVATHVSDDFTKLHGDGILGLGMVEGNRCLPDSCGTFMNITAPTLPKPLFTATLRRHAPGEYDFGFIDHSKYTGHIAYTAVNHGGTQMPTFWELLTPGYAIGDAKMTHYSMFAIADTGTTLVYVDQVIVDDYFADIPSAHLNARHGAYLFNCTDAPKLPNLSFFFGHRHKRTMPGSYVNYARVKRPKGFCFSGLQPNTDFGFSILGDAFLKSQFVVFDLDGPKLGFAQQAGVPI